MRESFESSPPPQLRELLRAPVRSTDVARQRIMEKIRALPAPRRLTAPIGASRWSRRGLLSPIAGLFTTALMICSVLLRVGSLQRLHTSVADVETATLVLGDSVVPINGAPLAGGAVGDSGAGSDSYARRVLDTLRIVEFVLRGSSVRSATVLGSFNAWHRDATPLATVSRDEWRARVLVPRDKLATSLRVAFLVNGTNLISATGGTARNLMYSH